MSLQLHQQLFSARYLENTRFALTQLENQKQTDINLLVLLKERLLVNNIHTKIIDFPHIVFPTEISVHNAIVRNAILEKIVHLQGSKHNWEQIKAFFIDNHEYIKISLNQWLYASPGILLELHKIPVTIPLHLQLWLLKSDVVIGDEVVHFHVISNDGRERFKKMGFVVSSLHWEKKDVQKGLKHAHSIINMNKNLKGLYCDGSWVLNPNNFLRMPDGKPFAAFDFITASKLIGELIDVTDWMDKNELKKQIAFATRNVRRKRLVITDAFQIRIFASFLSRK